MAERFTPYRMQYSDITGDNNSALFLAQLEYWQGIKGNDWVVKSVTDWWNELRITPKQVKRIKAELESFGYIEITLVYFKGSLTTGYRFSKQAVQKALSDGFDAYSTQPKGTSTKSTRTKSTDTKGTGGHIPKVPMAHVPKVPIHDNLRDYSITENTTEITSENTTENLKVAETSSAQLPLFDLPSGNEKKTSTKSPKQPKEKAPPAPPKFQRFKEWQDLYLFWYEKRNGMAHTFGQKEAGQLGQLITRLKQITKSDEDNAFLTFQAMLTNWDELKIYNRDRPQLNLILANLNSICTELKDAYEIELHSQRWGR